MIRKIILPLTIAAVIISCGKDEETTPAEETAPTTTATVVAVSYSTDIVPIVSSSCATASSCHNANSDRNYTTHSLLKIVADNGRLKQTVVDDKTMPQAGSLTAEQRTLFEDWISEGALNN